MKVSFLFFFAILLAGFSARSQCTAQFDYTTVSCDSLYFTPDTVYTQSMYVWNFGDGSSSTDPNAIHVYNANGTYNVSLLVYDSLNNCANDYILSVTVACDSTPVIDSCNIDFSFDFVTCDSVWFVPSINNPSAYYQWDMGDGNTYNWEDNAYTYAADGTYLVMLYYIDSVSNCWGIAEHFVTIACDSISPVDSCNIDFSIDFVTCDSVWFVPSISIYNPSASYQWDMGDGNTYNWGGNGYTYAADGTYLVMLYYIDSINNCWGIAEHFVTIACDSIPPVDSCNIDFSIDFVTCDSVWFIPSIYNPSAYYQWDMGDGNTYNWEGNGYTYAADGTYLVMLYYIDSINNCWGIAEHFVTIDCDSISPVDSCNANFDVDYMTCDSVWFIPSVYEPSALYSWNFGDGTVDYGAPMSHYYANDGSYPVTLIVEDTLNNCANVFTYYVTIMCDSIPPVDSCNIDFSIDFVTCDSVWFVPSIYNPSASYQWDMGDGNTYNWEGNGYTYAADGTYLVMLYYVDSINNCWGIAEHFVTIACDSISPVDSCNANFDVDFVTCDSVAFAPSMYQPTAFYIWNFGEGASDQNPFTAHQYTHDGTFVVTLTVIDCSNNCSASYTTTLNVDCDSTLGIQPVTDENALNVYPNPGTGIFYVELESEDATIQVYDLSGNMVLNTGCTDACNNFALDLSHLSNGAYSLVVIGNGGMQSTRIVKH